MHYKTLKNAFKIPKNALKYAFKMFKKSPIKENVIFNFILILQKIKQF